MALMYAGLLLTASSPLQSFDLPLEQSMVACLLLEARGRITGRASPLLESDGNRCRSTVIRGAPHPGSGDDGELAVVE